MSVEQMKQEILASPMAEVRGVERVKQMIERHDASFVKNMYELMVDDEEMAMLG